MFMISHKMPVQFGMTLSTDDALQRLRILIWERRPILGEIMQKHGGKNLFDYAKDFLDVNPAPLLDARKGELIDSVEELTSVRLGPEVAAAVARQLRKYPLVSTSDHHGPIDHPFWVNANIISALPYAERRDSALRFHVVFSFASVSVNNASGFARGILFHGGKNGSGNLVRLPLLPDKVKMGTVYNMRSITQEDLSKGAVELRKREREEVLVPGRAEKVQGVIEKYYGAEDVLAAEDLSTQISKINFRMWPNLFEKSGTIAVPDLVYIDIETIVREALLRHHLGNSTSLLWHVLFDASWRTSVERFFNGLPGAFSLEHEWGTHFFWALDAKNHRVRLKRVGDLLTSHDGALSLALTPEVIAEALRMRKIFPSMLLCYLVVALYYGMKCLGGFCQVHDLTMIKRAWAALLREQGLAIEADALEPVQTKELSGDGMVLSYFQTIHGSLVPSTGIDLLLEENRFPYDDYAALSHALTLSEAMNPMLPEMYTVLYSIDQRDPALASLSTEKILRETGLQQKLVAFFEKKRENAVLA